VPSLADSALVPDFARRVARALGLSFVPCVRKLRPARPQREMENSAQQAANLDGAFAVDEERVLAGAVLLIDDMIDSRWTMTVVGAQLVQAGSGPVFPLALAVATKNDDA
jgi:ATP-dependent DNA helicase RecQ